MHCNVFRRTAASRHSSSFWCLATDCSAPTACPAPPPPRAVHLHYGPYYHFYLGCCCSAAHLARTEGSIGLARYSHCYHSAAWTAFCVFSPYTHVAARISAAITATISTYTHHHRASPNLIFVAELSLPASDTCPHAPPNAVAIYLTYYSTTTLPILHRSNCCVTHLVAILVARKTWYMRLHVYIIRP